MVSNKFYGFLRWFRIAVALLVFIAVTLSFTFLGREIAQLSQVLKFQFVPSLLLFAGGGAVIFLVFLLLTLLFGRVYCSFICPLGIFQDCIGRISNIFKSKKQKRTKYSKPFNVLRYSILAIIFLFTIFGIMYPILMLDPYSIFGRFARHIFNPAIQLVSNSISTFFPESVYYRSFTPIVSGTLILTISFFIIIVIMSSLRGRLYCNTICPVGSLLGLISKISLFKLTINHSSCVGCAQCAKHCKAECIDENNRVIDESRCVACFNCMGVCTGGAISYKLRWNLFKKGEPLSKESHIKEMKGRREAIAAIGAIGALLVVRNWKKEKIEVAESGVSSNTREITGIIPPGGKGIEHLMNNCTACHACVAACPNEIITYAKGEYGLNGLFLPVIHYNSHFCGYDCKRCMEVCPSGALVNVPLADKQHIQVGKAKYTFRYCVVHTAGTDCGACDEHCPTKAITMVPLKTNENLFIPSVNRDICIGCGGCEYICPASPKAITIVPLSTHSTAKSPLKEIQEKKEVDDFGF